MMVDSHSRIVGVSGSYNLHGYIADACLVVPPPRRKKSTVIVWVWSYFFVGTCSFGSLGTNSSPPCCLLLTNTPCFILVWEVLWEGKTEEAT